MKTAILTVGTEILFGQVVNTNAAFLSQQLQDIGYDVISRKNLYVTKMCCAG